MATLVYVLVDLGGLGEITFDSVSSVDADLAETGEAPDSVHPSVPRCAAHWLDFHGVKGRKSVSVGVFVGECGIQRGVDEKSV